MAPVHRMDIPGRIAVVTGAGSGIGEAVSLELARRGIKALALVPDLAYFVLFLPMVLVLVFLPQGLFGRVQI